MQTVHGINQANCYTLNTNIRMLCEQKKALTVQITKKKCEEATEKKATRSNLRDRQENCGNSNKLYTDNAKWNLYIALYTVCHSAVFFSALMCLALFFFVCTL